MGNSSWSFNDGAHRLRAGYYGKFETLNGQMYAYEPDEEIKIDDVIIHVVSHSFGKVKKISKPGKITIKLFDPQVDVPADVVMNENELVKMVPLLTEKLVDTNKKTGVFDEFEE